MSSSLRDRLVHCTRRTGALGAFALAASVAIAAENPIVRNAWVRPTVPGQPVAAAYLEITSSSDASVVEVRSDAAASVQVHTMLRDGDVMRMRQVERVALPAGKTVTLAPGGMHLMLLDLKRALRAGDSIGLDLTLADAKGRRRTVHVAMPVRATGPSEAGR